jgi:hypothetical protein
MGVLFFGLSCKPPFPSTHVVANGVKHLSLFIGKGVAHDYGRRHSPQGKLDVAHKGGGAVDVLGLHP